MKSSSVYRKIIFFTGAVETLGFFSQEVAAYFKEQGYKTFFYDFKKDNKEQLFKFCEPGVTALFTFNFIGLSGEPVFQMQQGPSLWEAKDVLCLNMVVDHPLYYSKNLMMLPPKYIQFCIDMDHMAYMKSFYPFVTHLHFLPLGGTAYEKGKILSFKERPIDVLFTGNYVPLSNLDKGLKNIGPEYKQFFFQIIDRLKKHPELSLDVACRDGIFQEFPHIKKGEFVGCMHNMVYVDLFIRSFFRGEIVRALVDNHIPVTVLGKDWEKLKVNKPENLLIRSHEMVDSATCLTHMGQAKISLNVMPWFKKGAHDRVFNAQLNHSVCVTDPSDYLTFLFPDSRELAFYSLKDYQHALPSLIQRLLNHPDSSWELAQNGYKNALQAHTWKHRAYLLEQTISST